MAAVNVNRVNAPQAFVSSFAPRIRQYGNSLLTPVVPQSVLPQVRTTKRGTTAINYAEEFDDDSIEDTDNPRRATGLRTAQQRRDVDPAVEKAKELGKEATAPVEVQGIWRDWMGKPKRTMTERQLYLQAVLPTTLVPIRIDLDVAPFRPDAALPTPANAKDFGIDENLPAYKAPDVTPSYRLKDSFLWNLHEGLITPDMFAKVFVDELDFPILRKQTMIAEIAQQIRQQLEEHAAAALHPLFQPQSKEQTAPTTTAPTPSLRHAVSREDSSTPMQADTPRSPHTSHLSLVNGHHPTSGAQTPLANGTSTPAITVISQCAPSEETASSVLNPPDTHRCVLNISINLQNRLYSDKFEWSLQHPVGFAEIFAKRTCADIGLPGEWVPHMAHAIYESSLRLKKDMIDNNSTLAGVVGSGVDGWGVIDNEACEYHGTAESALGVGAGWRFDEDGLGFEWEPRIEVLNKEEIEKREGDRERQIRRQRRDHNRFSTNFPSQVQGSGIGNSDFFAGGLGSSQGPNGLSGGDDERMGRGERSKKKRRFRSLSPVGRETPEAAGFGGTSEKLTDGERQYWTCSHCNIWGQAVWGVRDGPKGPRVSPLLFANRKHISNSTDETIFARPSVIIAACSTSATNDFRLGVTAYSLSKRTKPLAKPKYRRPGQLNKLQRVRCRPILPPSQLRSHTRDKT
jgi:chromatin structure-remodeling complex subunit SFH1